MEITNAKLTVSALYINEAFTLSFKVVGAECPGFRFPFANESLTEPKLEFLEEE